VGPHHTTFFSPQMFRDLCLPRYRELERCIGIPWIVHSDGNMLPFMDDLLTLKISGFHPCERAAMDIRDMKHRFGGRLCVLGNVDLNTLGMGSPHEVVEEVTGLIRDVAPGGGYIIGSGNSLAGYLRPENVLAMRDTIRRDGKVSRDHSVIPLMGAEIGRERSRQHDSSSRRHHR
jgi:uroporphyrinogen decarboxylase